jgi:hypothetical protein
MGWKIIVDEQFIRFLGLINALSENAIINFAPDGINCKVVTSCNTTYGSLKVNTPLDCEPLSLALPVGKMLAVLPHSGEISLEYVEPVLAAKVGKTKFKFPKFAEGAVRKPPELNLNIEMSMGEIPVDEMRAVLSKILSYYSNDAILSSVQFRIVQSSFIVSDFPDANVESNIEAKIYKEVDTNVVLMLDMVQPIINSLQKFGNIEIGIMDKSKPIMIKGTYNNIECKYYLAPRDVD